MAPTGSSLDLAAWDAEIDGKSPDFEKLYQSMLKASKELNPAAQDSKALNIWWRLAKATFGVTYNFIYEGEGYYDAIKKKALEAWGYASKAVAIQANHFEANVWLAKSAGKVTQLELDAVKHVQSMKTFLGALATCKSINSEDPRVLFLDGRLQLMMLAMSEEHKTIINAQAHPKMLPEADLSMAETKLRKAIKLHPTISGHMILALVLLELDKVVEVKQVVESGLTLKRETRADEYAALQLEKVKSFLAEEAREAKSKGAYGSVHPSSMNLG